MGDHGQRDSHWARSHAHGVETDVHVGLGYACDRARVRYDIHVSPLLTLAPQTSLRRRTPLGDQHLACSGERGVGRRWWMESNSRRRRSHVSWRHVGCCCYAQPWGASPTLPGVGLGSGIQPSALDPSSHPWAPNGCMARPASSHWHGLCWRKHNVCLRMRWRGDTRRCPSPTPRS